MQLFVFCNTQSKNYFGDKWSSGADFGGLNSLNGGLGVASRDERVGVLTSCGCLVILPGISSPRLPGVSNEAPSFPFENGFPGFLLNKR